MKKDTFVFLQHILDAIQRIENNLDNTTKDAFSEDVDLQDATVRRLEVIGEAAKNVPDEFRKNHPAIPWKEIVGMRDRLIHHYFGVNLDRVWSTAKDDLPSLKKKLQDIMIAEEKKSKAAVNKQP